MTQIANIVVKDSASVDKTFVAYQPQAGTDPALWLLTDTTNPRVYWPRLNMRANRSSKAGSLVRRQKVDIVIPFFNTLGEKIGEAAFHGELLIADNTPVQVHKDLCSYIKGIYGAPLTQDSMLTMSAII